jgi:hypothetical protein
MVPLIRGEACAGGESCAWGETGPEVRWVGCESGVTALLL